MANVKNAIGNVLDTVVGTSNALCTTVGLVGKTAQLGSNWMDSMLNKQRVMLRVDDAQFKAVYLEHKAQELSASRLAVEEFVAKSPRHEELYNQSLTLLREAVG